MPFLLSDILHLRILYKPRRKSHLKKSKLSIIRRNISWHLIYQLVIVVLGFIIPKLIIEIYGSEANGLSSTISQTVSLVALLQAGISTAATYSLYKPITNANKEDISSILAAVKRTFRRVGCIVFVLGFIVSSALVFSIHSQIKPVFIYLACFLFFTKTSLDLYFSQHIRVFLMACQENYLISVSFLIEHVIYYSLTLIIIYFHVDFVLMYFALLLGCLCKIVFLYLVFEKLYRPYYIGTTPPARNIQNINMRYATINEISHSLVTATIPVIISISCGLAYSSIYSVYAMVFNLLVILSRTIYSSFSSSYGLMTAEGDYAKINYVFEIFQFCFFAFTTWIYMCAAYLFLPFVSIYTSNIRDMVYVDNLMMVMIVVYGCFYSYRIPYNITVSANGVFKATYLQPFITAIITILGSLLVTQFNYTFALIGPIVFYMINTFYQHFTLKKCIASFENNHFWKHIFVSVTCVAVSILFALLFPISCSGYIQWGSDAVATGLASLILLLIMLILFDRKSMLKTMVYFKKRLRRG